MSTDPLAALLDLPGVTAAATEARAAVDGLLGHRVLRRRSAEVTAESSLRGARAAVQLEGVPVELEQLRGLLMAGGELALPGRPERDAVVLQGAVRCYAELGSLLSTWERTPLQALARLHVLAARDLVVEDDLGRPRTRTEEVEDPLGLGPAPDPAEVSARLGGLAGLVVGGGSTAPAVVVAAVVHGELLALRPFVTANGIVARAAARLTLIARGLDPKSVSVPEVGHVELHHDYEEASRAYVAGGPDGVARWLVHVCTAVGLGAREGLAVCEAIRRDA